MCCTDAATRPHRPAVYSLRWPSRLVGSRPTGGWAGRRSPGGLPAVAAGPGGSTARGHGGEAQRQQRPAAGYGSAAGAAACRPPGWDIGGHGGLGLHVLLGLGVQWGQCLAAMRAEA